MHFVWSTISSRLWFVKINENFGLLKNIEVFNLDLREGKQLKEDKFFWDLVIDISIASVKCRPFEPNALK